MVLSFKSLFEKKIYTKQYFKMRKILTGAKHLLMSIFCLVNIKKYIEAYVVSKSVDWLYLTTAAFFASWKSPDVT